MRSSSAPTAYRVCRRADQGGAREWRPGQQGCRDVGSKLAAEASGTRHAACLTAGAPRSARANRQGSWTNRRCHRSRVQLRFGPASGAGTIRDCRKLSDQLLQLTAGKSDDELHLQAHHSAWATSMFAGDPAAAREHSETGRQLYDPERHRSHRLLYGGHDPGVCADSLGALGTGY